MNIVDQNLAAQQAKLRAIWRKRSAITRPESGTGQKICIRRCSHAPLTMQMHFIS